MTFQEMLDSINPFSSTPGVIDSVTDTYNQLTDAAKAKVKAWVGSVELVRNTPVPPNDKELIQWRQDILDRAAFIKRMIVSVVSDQSAKDMGLGLGPLVIVGGVAVTGILGYIAVQMMDMAKYYSRLNFINSTAATLIKQKVPSSAAFTKAAELADNAGEKRPMSLTTKIGIGLVAVGVIGLFLRRQS